MCDDWGNKFFESLPNYEEKKRPIKTAKISYLIDKLDSYIPDGDGYNSEYAHVLSETVEVLEALAMLTGFIKTDYE